MQNRFGGGLDPFIKPPSDFFVTKKIKFQNVGADNRYKGIQKLIYILFSSSSNSDLNYPTFWLLEFMQSLKTSIESFISSCLSVCGPKEGRLG